MATNDRLCSISAPLLDVMTGPASPPDNYSMKKRIETVMQRRSKGNKNTLVDIIQKKPSLSKLFSSECTVLSRTKVRFPLDHNDNIAKEYASLPKNHYLTKEEINRCWWTKKELQKIRERAQESCRSYLSCRPDYRKAAVRMLERCGAQKKGYIPELDPVLDDEENDEDDDLSIMVDGEARGLEKRLINAMNLPFYRHKRSICAVMDTQTRLRAMEPEFFSATQKARLIASQYGLNSRYAAAWARAIADGDAKAVARNFQFVL